MHIAKKKLHGISQTFQESRQEIQTTHRHNCRLTGTTSVAGMHRWLCTPCVCIRVSEQYLQIVNLPFDVVQAVGRVGQRGEHPALLVVVLAQDLALAQVEPVSDAEPAGVSGSVRHSARHLAWGGEIEYGDHP